MTAIDLTISFGGTGYTVALVDTRTRKLMGQSDRIAWSDRDSSRQTCKNSLNPIAITVDNLLQSYEKSIEMIRLIGIAWPGPGEYQKGVLQATFIPGCSQPQNIHETLREILQEQFNQDLAEIKFISRLDVHARTCGLIYLRDVTVNKHNRPHTVVLNVATGVAGTVIKDGSILKSHPEWGETYGQFGRYIFKQNTGKWAWRPSGNGAIKSYDRKTETRLTDLIGGPALVRRFDEYCRSIGGTLSDEMDRCLNELPDNGRDLIIERNLIEQITIDAYRGDPICSNFIEMIAGEIAHALRMVSEKFQVAGDYILTGGIGMNLGKPLHDSNTRDILLDSIKEELQGSVFRSAYGLDAELIGAVIQDSELP